MSVQQIIDCINENVQSYQASPCVYHRKKLCFLVTSKHDSKLYHALIESGSTKWFRFSDNASSFDYPQFVYYLIKMNETLGNDYVLKYASRLRDSRGILYFLFDMDTTHNLHNACRIGIENILYVYIGLIVITCETSRLLGGAMPDLNNMKLFYNHVHPVLADMGKKNCDKKTLARESKWYRFMHRTKPAFVIRFLVALMPKYFRRRKKTDSPCVFKTTGILDTVHELVCKSTGNSLFEILNKYLESDSSRYYKDQVKSLLEKCSSI